MKHISAILIGIFSPLFYYLVSNLMMYFEYNEKYALIQNALLFILPALPGIALAFLLIKDSLKNFFKFLGICFLISVFTILVYNLINVDLMIYKAVTGYDEFGLGEGLLFAVTSMSYIISCFIGTVISGIVTMYRQKKNSSETKKIQ